MNALPILSLSLLALFGGQAMAAECPSLLQHDLPQLRSKNSIDLCQRFAGKPLVVVNTASHCGFTPQFKGLEALYKRYKDEGLEVLGVPSDDFKQEAASTEETAKVCYENYGVTFVMTQPQHVTGDQAIPLYKELIAQSGQTPRWNFYKYVVDRQGKVIAHFSSLTKPDDPDLLKAVEQALASQP
ncbi:putative glutathione peroxidase [compost metagenome]|jgi:glutathione peroxidase